MKQMIAFIVVPHVCAVAFSFPTPNDYLLNLDATIATYDITSGAVDGMCEALSSIITSDGAGVRINLLFSHEAEGVRLTSHLSRSGRLEIENGSGRPVLVRIPSWVDKKEVYLKVKWCGISEDIHPVIFTYYWQ